MANPDGKIAGKEAKVQAPVTAAVIGVDRDDARCVDTTVKRAVQSFAAIAKGHRRCKKSGMKSGAVLDAATLDAACGSLAQVDGTGQALARLGKLTSDVGVACGTSAAGLAALFPGLDAPCHADGTALGGCVAARTRCRACLAINDADGQHIDCDLFDDGTANASCFAFALGTHTCTLAPSSELLMLNALPLSLDITGAVKVSCGTTDAAQAAACTCDLASFGPLAVPAIGDLCVAPAPGCPPGGIDCDGGPPRDRELASDHNIGSCASNAACAAACDAHCAGRGAAYGRQTSGCEGYCQGGASGDLPCTQDSDCPGASCVGSNPPSHPGVCNCACEGSGLGAPSLPPPRLLARPADPRRVAVRRRLPRRQHRDTAAALRRRHHRDRDRQQRRQQQYAQPHLPAVRHDHQRRGAVVRHHRGRQPQRPATGRLHGALRLQPGRRLHATVPGLPMTQPGGRRRTAPRGPSCSRSALRHRGLRPRPPLPCRAATA